MISKTRENLFAACLEKDLKAFWSVIEDVSDINISNKFGETALHLACLNNNADDTSMNKREDHAYVIVKQLLRLGADPLKETVDFTTEQPSKWGSQDKNRIPNDSGGTSPLHYAMLSHASSSVILVLLDYGKLYVTVY
jgi:ankyrin repeat protein